jgi:hypothetical protein
MPESSEDAAFTISIGSVSFVCRNGRFTTEINKPDRASGTIPAEDMARSPADWAASANVSIGADRVTAGRVAEAIPAGDGSVALSLRSGHMMDENLMPPMVCQNLPAQEIVYAVARAAGFEPANLHIEGLEEVSTFEPLWVLAPVEGVSIDRPVHIGVVEFVDGTAGRTMLRRFSPALDPKFSEPLEEAAAFARVPVAGYHLWDAEEEGLRLIDTAAAWLMTRLRYSWSHGPDGNLQHYERALTSVVVERRDGVGVLAVDGNRRWWRGTTVDRKSGEVALGSATRWMEPAMPASVTFGDRQALLALQRAATATDPVQRVSALWEAVEFYVGKLAPEALFTRDEIDAIVQGACSGLSDQKADRVQNVLRGSLNQFSVRARLAHVLAQDGVPVTDDDLALLGRLRVDRNKALHGSASAPSHDDIDRAVAFVSRAITTRWQRG